MRSRASILLLVAALAVGTSVMSGIVLRDEIAELWYLSELEHGGTEDRYHAAHWLGEHGSLRAIEGLIDALRADDETAGERTIYRQALVAIGAPSVEALERALLERDHQLRWNAALTLRELTEGLAGPRRRELAEALERDDQLAAERLYEELVRLPGRRPGDWKALARCRAAREDWSGVLEAHDRALALIERDLRMRVEQRIVRYLEAGSAARPRAGSSTLAFYDWTWDHVHGPETTIARKGTDIARVAVDIRVERARLLRDRLGDSEAALEVFRGLLPAGEPLLDLPIPELCAHICRHIQGEESTMPPTSHKPVPVTALRELVTTRSRMDPSPEGLRDLARLLLVGPERTHGRRLLVSQLASLYHTVARVEPLVEPPRPLILLPPEGRAVTVDVRQPTPDAMPFRAFVNPNTDIRRYAFVAPPGHEIEKAEVTGPEGAILIPSVMSWDGVVRRQLEFPPRHGILLVAVNNARKVTEFQVRASLRPKT